ncbi:hypothetical protein [Cellulomonas fengjieae]|uniref:Lipoprotein n=1 Tax=Cellulomonas fengjieae TaxID=2819978 RepID=A0ABS3SHJ7_9CELL|nr:hypothetical protein [Cellulomonas fengjieae]MBO3085223.1 hypothetical protein [Cellulomonas fengjieae]QVI66211.1 hypothetical protein KG102_00830 [Cellulomonas fengjieae]
MRTRTLVGVAAVSLTVVAGATAYALRPTAAPGADPAMWPVETLTAAPAALPHALHVTPADCPGFSLMSPVPEDSRNVPGSGSYTVLLGGAHHALWVCLGPVAQTGGARASVEDQLGLDDSVEGVEMYSRDATLVHAPAGELVRVDRAFGPAEPPRLTDWLVDHGGYTYAFGYLHPTDDASRWADVEAMLASVTWDE